MIENLQTDSKQHLHDTQNNGHLHLVRVGEDQLVLGHVPDRVQSKRVGGLVFHSLAGDVGEMTPRRKLDTRWVWTAPEYVTGWLTEKNELKSKITVTYPNVYAKCCVTEILGEYTVRLIN